MERNTVKDNLLYTRHEQDQAAEIPTWMGEMVPTVYSLLRCWACCGQCQLPDGETSSLRVWPPIDFSRSPGWLHTHAHMGSTNWIYWVNKNKIWNEEGRFLGKIWKELEGQMGVHRTIVYCFMYELLKEKNEKAWCGGTGLQSQHLGGRNRGIWDLQASLVDIEGFGLARAEEWDPVGRKLKKILLTVADSEFEYLGSR